jgi:stearoyl-CoA desaturase (delta-9 desaturase)
MRVFSVRAASASTTAARSIESSAHRYPNVLDYVGYAGLHLTCLGALWVGASWRDLALCAVSYLARMFGLMAGYHRYFAHRSFKTSRPIQFLLALVGTLAVQKGVLWWTSTHRHHHRYSDTEFDLHSPMHKSFLYAHSGWFLDQANRNTDYSRVQDLARYPELVWLDRWSLLPIAVFAILIWLGFGWGGVIWGFCISTVLIWHAIHSIGSFGHRFGGYRRFATADNSRNKWFLALVLLGEGWHNNHHFYPSSARAGFVWWEYDIVYWALKCMERLGLVWDLRVPPEAVRRAKDPRAQAQVRRFERWLVELRVGLAQRLEARAAEGGPQEARLRLLRQALELRLDAFAAQATDQILRDPEKLRGRLTELRRDLAGEAGSLAGVSETETAAIARDLEAELVARLSDCSFAHFLTLPDVPRCR